VEGTVSRLLICLDSVRIGWVCSFHSTAHTLSPAALDDRHGSSTCAVPSAGDTALVCYATQSQSREAHPYSCDIRPLNKRLLISFLILPPSACISLPTTVEPNHLRHQKCSSGWASTPPPPASGTTTKSTHDSYVCLAPFPYHHH